MFTGLIRCQGTICRREMAGDLVLQIQPEDPTFPLEIGASIACNGICLTITGITDGAFTASLSAETLACTTAGTWNEGDRINLEPSLRAGDALGGHFVSGHVDGVARVISKTASGDSHVWEFEAPETLARFIAPKGSVTLNGVSLTVNNVKENRFGVNIIPHTAAVTNFASLKVGDMSNLEIDLLARYAARLMESAA